MTDHPNAEALRNGYEAFANGDMETVAALLADDITWHQAGDSPLSGDHQNRDAVFGVVFARLADLTAGTFRFEIHDILANDTHAVLLLHQSWEKPHPFRGNAVHAWHMHDGIATEAWIMFHDQQAADAALTP
jgi:ketosteroid isomerase-like protein